ncbi:dnaJ homolog subfamily C member 16 isoform X1 [Punica granatum]|nr:dnaJ homolog subfamily C member 16 isoform X1 [Punica granatum]XP_031404363.1 dnaJ homolog subfamily C member 16 isoform X1 [Punica granatum]PKI33756.1 hypothetical protein CRG98_045854 [Punica granatum]
MAMVSSTLTRVKAYALPLILFTGAMFFQLIVIPQSFPRSHYDVLGVRMYASVEEVEEAYEKLSSKWKSDTDSSNSFDFVKVRYAYELLTNPIWKRNYDIFEIEEQPHVIEEAKQRFAGKRFSDVQLPLLDDASVQGEDNFNAITAEDFQLILQSDKPSMVLIYSSGSVCCTQYDGTWKRIVSLLDGIANAAAIELREVQLAAYLADKRPTGRSFFRNGLPSVVAFPSGCKTVGCSIRFEGQLSVDAVTDWFATIVLRLPRILYYSKESLAQKFMAKISPHKVKVIFFSKTGERATPFIRLAALKYWDHASFAFLLWREEDSSFWWNAFEVESAPSIVFLKDPGVKPVVHHGPVNNSQFTDLMEQNKNQELPQLRAETSNELGCDARGYSRAGADTLSWYCVVLAGRLSPELNSMRATMRRVQEIISHDNEDSSVPATVASKRKRLTFTWLNGETQKKYCFFYLQSETSYETCGPRRDISDVPRLFIVRYTRNLTEENEPVRRKPKTMWDALNDQEYDRASQLVARYNGSNEIPQIIEWVSSIIRDGDSRDLPFFKTKTPELVPEDMDPIISRGVGSVLSKSTGLKHKIYGFVRGLHDRLGDPRIGPVLLLGALISFGSTWLRRSREKSPPSQSNQSNQSNEPTQPKSKEEIRKLRRRRERNEERPSSITDVEPKNAYQAPLSDSDSN